MMTIILLISEGVETSDNCLARKCLIANLKEKSARDRNGLKQYFKMKTSLVLGEEKVDAEYSNINKDPSTRSNRRQ